jgi:hypothetical protein
MTSKWQAQLLKDGVDAATVAKLAKSMGVKATCDHYVAVTQAQASNAVRKLGR